MECQTVEISKTLKRSPGLTERQSVVKRFMERVHSLWLWKISSSDAIGLYCKTAAPELFRYSNETIDQVAFVDREGKSQSWNGFSADSSVG